MYTKHSLITLNKPTKMSARLEPTCIRPSTQLRESLHA